VPGPRDCTYRGYLLLENRWLRLQGTRRVLLNVRYAPCFAAQRNDAMCQGQAVTLLNRLRSTAIDLWDTFARPRSRVTVAAQGRVG
jgi:hypothetical protein